MVVLLHCSVYGVMTPALKITWWFSNLYDGVCHLAVPVFIILSGYFYDINHKNRWGKIGKTAILYLVWSVFYSIFTIFVQKGEVSLKGICTETLNSFVHPFNHLWYLPAILAVWISAKFINLESKSVIAFSIGILLVTSGYVYGGWNLNDKYWLSGLYTYLCSLSYFVMGYRLRRHDEKKDKVAIWVALFVISAVITVAGTGILVSKGITSYPLYEYGTLNIAVMAVSFFALFRNRNTVSQTKRFFVEAHGETLGIYLIHIAIRNLLEKIIGYFKIDMGFVINPFGIVIMALIVWLVSFGIVRICKRIPIINSLYRI